MAMPFQWFRQVVASDIAVYAEQAQGFQAQRPGLLRRVSIMLTPSLACATLYRVAHGLHRRGWRRLAWGAMMLNSVVNRALIDATSEIGPSLYIPHPSGIVFRGRAGSRLAIYTKSIVGPIAPIPFDGRSLVPTPVMGDDVSLGVNCLVLGPVTLGNGVRIGPGVTVTKDVPSGATLVAGQFRPQVVASPDLA